MFLKFLVNRWRQIIGSNGSHFLNGAAVSPAGGRISGSFSGIYSVSTDTNPSGSGKKRMLEAVRTENELGEEFPNQLVANSDSPGDMAISEVPAAVVQNLHCGLPPETCCLRAASD